GGPFGRAPSDANAKLATVASTRVSAVRAVFIFTPPSAFKSREREQPRAFYTYSEIIFGILECAFTGRLRRQSAPVFRTLAGSIAGSRIERSLAWWRLR